MFPTRYGQEASGGGGGGDAAAAAGILEAVGGIVTGVGDVVYIGRMTESKVFTNIADYQDYFQDNLNDLNTLKEHLRKYKRWLADSGNLASWCDGATATNFAPAGRKTCTELYHLKPPQPNPGGHRCGSPACQCKTNACAYRNPALADNYKSWIKKASGRGWGAGWTNPPALSGRGVTWRIGYLREAWNYLMTVAPAVPIWNMQNPGEQVSVATSMLTQENVLRTIFPELDGQMPLDMQDHWWNTISTLGALRLPPYSTPESTLPYFVFGFTEKEAKELFPDTVKRRAVFSLRYMVSLQRMYTDQLLAASGATDVFAGVSYGADAYGAEIPPAGADAATMHNLIVEAASLDNPVQNGEPSTVVRGKIGQRRGTFTAVAGVPPMIQRFQRMSDADLALAARTSTLASGILATRQRAIEEGIDDYIAPNYTPLVVGGLGLLAGAFLRRRRG